MRAGGPVVALLVAAVGTAAAVAAGGAAEPAALTTPSSESVAVTQATLVCPGVAAAGGSATTTVTATSPAGATGSLQLQALGAADGAAALATATAGRFTLQYAVPAGPSRTFVLRASGDRAPGLAGSVLTRTPSGAGRGLSSVACTAPTSAAWFVGAGASVGERAAIHLVNVDSAPASVDLRVYTSTGMQQPTAAQGVLVAAGKEVVLPLDALVPGVAATAIELRTRSGRVAAAVHDTQVSGLDPRGTDWVPAAVAPTTSLVVPAVPDSPDAKRVLQVVAPGDTDAVVKVRLVGTDGAIVPVGLESLDVAAGTLLTLPLDDVATVDRFAVQLESDQPVTAGVRTQVAPSGALLDLTFAAAAPAIDGAAVVSEAHTAGAVRTVLLLSATGDSDATVTVRAIPLAGGAIRTTTVKVLVGTTAKVPVGTGAGQAIVVTPVGGSGRVHGGWLVTEIGARGPLVTGQPLVAGPSTVQVPPAWPDPAVGLPGH